MGNTVGWTTFAGTVVSTIIAYNISSFLAEKTMFAFLPYGVDEYIKYLPRMARKIAKKAFIFLSIIEMIVMFFSNMLFLWLFNAIVLQIIIYIQCKKLNSETVKVSAINALGGSIAASVALVVWQILGLIPLLNIITLIEGLPLIGMLVVPLILMIFNLIFGAGVAKTVAVNQACPTNETFDNKTQKQPKNPIKNV